MKFTPDKSNYLFIAERHEKVLTPHDFQREAFRAMDDLLRLNPEGFASILVLPTGGGKTFTATHWIIKNYVDKGIKVLWIAHRSELIKQAGLSFYQNATFETLPSRESFKVSLISGEFGRSVSINADNPDVIVASRQSAVSYNNLSYFLKWARGTDKRADRRLLLVIDEAHHAPASSYRKIMAALKRNVPLLDILGLTATPYRTSKDEEGALKRIFNTGSGIVYSIGKDVLTNAQILANPIYVDPIRTGFDMTSVLDEEDIKKLRHSEITSIGEEKLRKIAENAPRNRLIVDTYLKKRKLYGKTVVFAMDRMDAVALDAVFKSVGVRSEFLISGLVDESGRFNMDDNPEKISAFREGDIEVLINVNILSEGTDIPNIQTVFLTRPTKSKILVEQMIGRALRGPEAKGTKEAYIVFFIDEWRDMINFPTPRELMEGDGSVPEDTAQYKKRLIELIRVSDVASAAVSFYEITPAIAADAKNIFPYGVLYYPSDADGEGADAEADSWPVYDESKEAIEGVLRDIPDAVDLEKEYSKNDVFRIGADLYFKYAERYEHNLVKFSSRLVTEIVGYYLEEGKLPVILPLKDRVDINALVESIRAEYSALETYEEMRAMLRELWINDSGIHSWYKDFDLFFNYVNSKVISMENRELKGPQFILPKKEDMSMKELSKYYPEYWQELHDYVYNMAYDAEEDCYVSALPWKGRTYKSKAKIEFEIDHIIPISEGGKTVKENLRLLYWKINRERGNKTDDEMENPEAPSSRSTS